MRHRAKVFRVSATQAFSPVDYCRLEQMLQNRPQIVLEAFGLAQVSCLAEVDAYHRIKADRPDLALRIVAIAGLMGIPESIEVSEDIASISHIALDG